MSSSPKEMSKKPDVFLAMVPHLSPIKPDQPSFAFSPLSLRALVSLIAAGASGPTLQQLLSFLGARSIDDVHARSSDLAHLQKQTTAAQGESKEDSSKRRKVVEKGNDGGPNPSVGVSIHDLIADQEHLLTTAGPKLSFSNALWVQEGLSLNPSFKEVLDSVYKASSFEVDFVNTEGSKIISEVHSWAEEKTNGLIKKILPPNAVNIDTRLILANTLYFKGKWLEEYFRVSNTQEDEFHLLGGDSVNAPLRRSHNGSHYVGMYDGFKVLRLPYEQGSLGEGSLRARLQSSAPSFTALRPRYKQGKHDKCRFSMYIFLPGAKDGLPALS